MRVAEESLCTELILDRLLAKIIGVCREAVMSEQVAVVIDAEGAVIRATADDSDEIVLRHAPLSEGHYAPRLLIQDALRSSRVILLDDPARDPRFKADCYFKTHAAGSVLAFPLISDAECCLGALYFENGQDGMPFLEKHVESLQSLSGEIVNALRNSLMFEESRAAESQLRERDRYLSMTFRQFPGAVWTTDRELKLSYVTGRPVNEARSSPPVGTSVYEFVGTQDPTEPLIAHHLAALSGLRQSLEYNFNQRWFTILIEPLRDEDGTVTGCVGAAFDVTDQRAIAERLMQSEALLAEAQRVAHIGSFEWDIVTNHVTWSDEMYRIYGLSREEFGGTYEAFARHIHPDDVEVTKNAVFDALRNIRPFTYDHRIVRPEGTTRILHTRAEVMTSSDNTPARIVGSCWDITEREENLRALERVRSLLEATIEATADGILVVGQDGKVTANNRRFLSLWKIPAEFAIKADDNQLLDFVSDQLEDTAGFIRGVMRLYEQADRESFDVIRLKDGRVFERYSKPQRVKEEIVGRVWSFHDVTERERLYRRALFLADATRLLASLDVEPALDSVAHLCVPFIADECAVDLLGNGGPRRLLVVSRDSSQPIARELHAAVLSGHASLYMIGQRSCMAVPLLAKDVVIGAMTFVASQGRRYTSTDMELAADLAIRAALSVSNASLYRSAREALDARDEFLSIAAHEIRGPITSIHMAVQGLQKGKVSRDAMERVFEIIEREDRRLVRFVGELLDLGSIRSGHIHFTFENVDLSDVVREAASRFAPELSKAGSSLTIKTSGKTAGEWDRFRVEQVVTNLLSNAIKFGLGKPISMEVSESAEYVVLTVADQGVGIPAGMLDRIFNPFERAVSVRHYGGLGLGLFIVRTIVQGLGGTVRVQSKPQMGSTFTVELPRRRD